MSLCHATLHLPLKLFHSACSSQLMFMSSTLTVLLAFRQQPCLHLNELQQLLQLKVTSNVAFTLHNRIHRITTM